MHSTQPITAPATTPRTTPTVARPSLILLLLLMFSSPALAQTTISDFNNFAADFVFGSWADPTATIISGPDSYDVTATGYGRNFTFIGGTPIAGAGNLLLNLEVTLQGPPEADGQLGVILRLTDADDTSHTYAWYNQPLGALDLSTALTNLADTPVPGSTPGLDLDLDTLTYLELELDPGFLGTSAPYTVQWQHLTLTVPEPTTFTAFATASFVLLNTRRRRHR